MLIEKQKFYPGEEATPSELLQLAAEYRRAADILFATRRPKSSISLSPYRLVVIQSVELYLDAYLRTKGHHPTSLRGMPHNFSARANLATDAGLNLRDGTKAHLRQITKSREYLVARYDPDPHEKLSELTRLSATLEDVQKKVEAAISRK